MASSGGVRYALRMAPEVLEAALRALPKTDLHCHLDGSVRLSTLQSLAEPRVSQAELRTRLHLGEPCQDLDQYLEAFRYTLPRLQRPEALRRVARELVLDAAEDGVTWLEVRFCPTLHTIDGVKASEVIDAVLEGLRSGRTETGLQSGLIICMMRERSIEEAEALSALALAYRERGCLGIDLAGSEAHSPVEPFAPIFRRARQAGLHVTIHAGEAAGPSSVRAALAEAGAERIGHACRAVEDPELLTILADTQVVVEACPWSNVQTGAAASLAEHPIERLRRAGVAVTVATDNRLVTDTTASRELARVAETFAWNAETIGDVVLAGFRGAFAPDDVKDELQRAATEAWAEPGLD